jgi:hypothetical protein
VELPKKVKKFSVSTLAGTNAGQALRIRYPTCLGIEARAHAILTYVSNSIRVKVSVLLPKLHPSFGQQLTAARLLSSPS